MQPCPNCGSAKPHAGACPAVAQPGSLKQASYESQELSAGKVLQGRYEILHILGQGGMGTVYMARDLRLTGRSCVVKKLRDDYFRDEDRQKAQEFFQREMEVLAGLDAECPNIVRVQDFFTENGRFFLVMDYVQGSNLHQMLHTDRSGEPFSEETVLKWAKEICDVLIYLHDQHPPIIYRDLKPSNVMIDVNGRVKLVDFGIARRAESGENTHVVSAGYSPPEQYWGSADVRSDIYALGATMYFLLTSRDPDALHICSPRAVNPNVSEALDRVVQKCTNQELNDRYQTAQELWEALLHTDVEAPPQSSNSRVWEAVTGVIVLAVTGFIFFIQPSANNSDQTGSTRKNVNQNMLPSEQALPTDARASHRVGEKGKKPPVKGGLGQPEPEPNKNSTHADLAVQMMDEPDLTDPAGLPEHLNAGAERR